MVHRDGEIVEHNDHTLLLSLLAARAGLEVLDQAQLMRQIERGERFIGEDPARRSREHPRQQYPRPLAARQAAGRPVTQIVERQRSDGCVDSLCALIAPRQAAQRDQAFNRHIPRDFGRLREIADRPRPLARVEVGQVAVCQRQAARARPN